MVVCEFIITTILQRSSCSHFAQLATSIAVKVGGGDCDDDESLELKNHFPDFLWLLRDVTLLPTGENGREVSPTEYLMTKVFRRSKSFKESESDQVARAILTMFPTITCKTIQPPSSDPTVMRNIASKQECLDPQFNQQVEELIQYVLEHVQGKRGGDVAGKVADGPILAAMATHYLEAVNDPDAMPCISDTWQTTVKIRCSMVIKQLLEEYEQDMEAKITEKGLPIEEDSPDNTDPTKPSTLFALHRSILLQKITALLKQVGHFVTATAYAASDGSVSTISKANLIAELTAHAAIFKEELIEQEIRGEPVRKKKVTGGILFKYASRNHSESRSSCDKLFQTLYRPIEEKMKQTDHNYSFKMLLKDLEELQEKYYKEAIGPAKWEVYEEKRAFIKAQEKSYKSVHGFKKEAFTAAQEAADASAKNAKLEEYVKTLLMQLKSDGDMYLKQFQELQQHHEEEMEKCRKEEAERMEKERQKCEDFMKAQMKEMADTTKENIEFMKSKHEAMLAMIRKMNDDHKASMDVLRATNMRIEKAIQEARK